MAKGKPVREKGKLKLSRYFQKFEKGDNVSVVREISLAADFPKRFQGRTGVVEGMQGRSVVIRIKDQNKEKTLIVPPIHLKKIKTNNKQDDRK
jgi:large subunit ribosomal protein L21e